MTSHNCVYVKISIWSDQLGDPIFDNIGPLNMVAFSWLILFKDSTIKGTAHLPNACGVSDWLRVVCHIQLIHQHDIQCHHDSCGYSVRSLLCAFGKDVYYVDCILDGQSFSNKSIIPCSPPVRFDWLINIQYQIAGQSSVDIEYWSADMSGMYTMYNLADVCWDILNHMMSSYYLGYYHILSLNGMTI